MTVLSSHDTVPGLPGTCPGWSASRALPFFLSGVLAFLGPLGAQEPGSPSEVRDSDIPSLGLSSRVRLGLPGVEYDSIARYSPYYRAGGVPHRYDRRWSASGWQRRYLREGHGPYGWGWHPWYGIPQTEKRKVHYPAVYSTPRLGLQYTYPDVEPLGLRPPPDPEEPLVPARPVAGIAGTTSQAVLLALELFRAGRDAEAGRVLSEEVKAEVATLETYLVLSEILVARGAFLSAARILRHGTVVADSLEALEGLDISYHFPSRELFADRLGELDEAVQLRSGDAARRGEHDLLAFLHASFRLLSGDGGAVRDLQTLEESRFVGDPSRRLNVYFVDRLLELEASSAGAGGRRREDTRGDAAREAE